MSLFRPQATKVFHHISKLQTAPISCTTATKKRAQAPKPPDSQRPWKKSKPRPTYTTKPSTPAGRHRGRRHLDLDLRLVGTNLPDASLRFGREDEFPASISKIDKTPQFEPMPRPFIGVSSRLRTRRLMTPMTPTSRVGAAASNSHTRSPLASTFGVSTRQRIAAKTPMVSVSNVRAMTSGPASWKRESHVGWSNPGMRLIAASAPMTAPVQGPSTSAFPFVMQKRTFTKKLDCTEVNIKSRGPCFDVKKMRPKKPKEKWISPCACDYEKPNQNRCALWKCRASFGPCPKPPSKIYQCPVRVRKPRMRKLAIQPRKVRLPKKCRQPKVKAPFQCFPKPPPPPLPPMPTPRRCPCFKPRELPPPPKCRKMRCAIEPNCSAKKIDSTCEHCDK